ncbi:hypothetical protein D3C84_1188500 [compost metagenome]
MRRSNIPGFAAAIGATIGVRICPGDTELTRIPSVPRASASERTNDNMPPFDAL